MDPRLIYALLALVVVALVFGAYRLYTRKSPTCPASPACPLPPPPCPACPACPPPLLTLYSVVTMLGILQEMYATGCQCDFSNDVVTTAITSAQAAAGQGDRTGMLAALSNPAVNTQLSAVAGQPGLTDAQVYLLNQVQNSINNLVFN